MYAVRETLDGPPLPPGTSLLVSGPTTGDTRALVFDLLGEGGRRGDAAVVFSTDDEASRVRASLTERVDDDQPQIGVVSPGPGSGEATNPLTRHVASPGDFAGAGVAISELVAEVPDRRGVRVAVHSVSDLLSAADVKTVFRFLHVLTGRIGAADALGIVTLDADAHDRQTISTLRQLFDGLVEIRTGPEGERERRVRGLGTVEATWEPF